MNTGDVVILKSGGPLMTVIAIDAPGGPGTQACKVVYMNDRQQVTERTFPVAALDVWVRQ